MIARKIFRLLPRMTLLVLVAVLISSTGFTYSHKDKLVSFFPPTPSNPACPLPFYRLRSPSSGEHFYTSDFNEVVGLINNAHFIPEGIAGYVDATSQSGDTPLYRLRGATSGIHFYTTSNSEEAALVNSGAYVSEGIAGYVRSSGGANLATFNRLFNPSNGLHLYTASSTETATVEAVGGYVSEGNAGYVYMSDPVTCHEPLYRLKYPPQFVFNYLHFYTASYNEFVNAVDAGKYVPEGIAGYIDATDQSGDEPLYRILLNVNGEHFYTTSSTEVASLLAETNANGNLVNTNEGIAGYVSSSGGTNLVEFYRLYSPFFGHFYTADQNEVNTLMAALGPQIQSEGNAGYVYTGM